MSFNRNASFQLETVRERSSQKARDTSLLRIVIDIDVMVKPLLIVFACGICISDTYYMPNTLQKTVMIMLIASRMSMCTG